MSAGYHFRATTLIEIELGINHCLENHRLAHLYLHEGRWVISAQPRNDIADDKVGEWAWVPKMQAAAQQLDIDRKVLRTMLSEVS